MGTERFIQGKHDNARHAGRRSITRRLMGAMEQISEWRRERTIAHQMGEDAELCYPGEKDGHFQLPPEIEEGGLVEPFSGHPKNGILQEYPEGRGQEIELWENEGGRPYEPPPPLSWFPREPYEDWLTQRQAKGARDGKRTR